MDKYREMFAGQEGSTEGSFPATSQACTAAWVLPRNITAVDRHREVLVECWEEERQRGFSATYEDVVLCAAWHLA